MRPDDAPFGEPAFRQLHHADSAATRAEIVAGLEADPPRAAPKFLYDALGSKLFEAITELPEYYPTRTEKAIVDRHAVEIAARVGPGATLVDLGAGNCEKAARLFGVLNPACYVAVDISVEFVREALMKLSVRHPRIEMSGYGLDFSVRLALPPEALRGRPVFHYPGSSIGNFAPDDALRLLRQVRDHVARGDAGGGLLVGIDLVKPREVLEAAYDDALGVTAAFNLNLLRHLNRCIGSDFDPAGWRHVAFYDEAHRRVEMHLEARSAQTVRWPGGGRRFAAGARLHTEHSHKYTVDGFGAMLAAAGFDDVACWRDERGWFAVVWATVG